MEHARPCRFLSPLLGIALTATIYLACSLFPGSSIHFVSWIQDIQDSRLICAVW
ncbi:hypothetical protein BDV24DRAFT_123447 [Aspergillus arachidicola]|uniref:Uncharacterized protein n=1 Tax=Aspergillus arachidicola TaxID=656916 RepID=A0A5N6YPJ0_9EURO|nr:hypothetical protein BDV24DRAFT_123447 [Aspergillus arachidicola]